MTGLDKPIHDQIKSFTSNIFKSVLAGKKQYNGRVYKINRDDKIIGAVHVAGSNDYEDVRFDDRYSVLCFFDPADESVNIGGGLLSTECSIVFAINLKEVYPLELDRAIEMAHSEVLKDIERCGVFKVNRIITGSRVYGDLESEDLKQYDMHPRHVFRVNCSTQYSLNCNFKNY